VCVEKSLEISTEKRYRKLSLNTWHSRVHSFYRDYRKPYLFLNVTIEPELITKFCRIHMYNHSHLLINRPGVNLIKLLGAYLGA